MKLELCAGEVEVLLICLGSLLYPDGGQLHMIFNKKGHCGCRVGPDALAGVTHFNIEEAMITELKRLIVEIARK